MKLPEDEGLRFVAGLLVACIAGTLLWGAIIAVLMWTVGT